MEVLALQGLSQLLDTIKEVKKVLNAGLEIKGIIPSMFDIRKNLSREILEAIEKNFKVRVFKTHIRECVKIAERPQL